MSSKIFLLTGKPGVGKTTLLRKIVNSIPKIAGFITEEVLDENGDRIGFQMVSLNEPFEKRQLARPYQMNLDFSTKFGRWSILFDEVEYFTEKYMKVPDRGTIFILDEIGPMQCSSRKFMKNVKELIENSEKGGYTIIGTIKQDPSRIPSIDEFICQVKNFAGDSVIEVTEFNREEIYEKIMKNI